MLLYDRQKGTPCEYGMLSPITGSTLSDQCFSFRIFHKMQWILESDQRPAGRLRESSELPLGLKIPTLHEQYIEQLKTVH